MSRRDAASSAAVHVAPTRAPARLPARLSSARERLVYVILAGTWLSGVAWLVLHFFLRNAGEFGSLPHPLEAWALRLHGAFAFAALWLGGLLWAAHIPPAWAQHRQRITGSVLLATFVLLVLTGYGLYYLGDEGWREVASLVHWIIGLAGLVILPLHGLRARGKR